MNYTSPLNTVSFLMPGHQKFKNAKMYLFCQKWAISAEILVIKGQGIIGVVFFSEYEKINKKIIKSMYEERCTPLPPDQRIFEYPFKGPFCGSNILFYGIQFSNIHNLVHFQLFITNSLKVHFVILTCYFYSIVQLYSKQVHFLIFSHFWFCSCELCMIYCNTL